MTTTTTTTWKELLLGALESNSHVKYSYFFQLSTLGLHGSPSNRTVQELKNRPVAEICWYFTDSREQFRINGAVEIIDGSNPDRQRLQEYSRTKGKLTQQVLMELVRAIVAEPKKSKICNALIAVKNKREKEEYYRLIGLAEKRKGLQRERAGCSCSLRSRMQYLGPAPGLPHLIETEHSSIQNSLDPAAGPVGAFCLLVLAPDEIDYLNLKSNSRLNFTSSQGPTEVQCWTVKMINP